MKRGMTSDVGGGGQKRSKVMWIVFDLQNWKGELRMKDDVIFALF